MAWARASPSLGIISPVMGETRGRVMRWRDEQVVSSVSVVVDVDFLNVCVVDEYGVGGAFRRESKLYCRTVPLAFLA